MMIAMIRADGMQMAVNVDDIVYIRKASTENTTFIQIRHEAAETEIEGKFLDVMNVLNEEQS